MKPETVLPNELLFEAICFVPFHKKWSTIRVCIVFDQFLLERMAQFLISYKNTTFNCLDEILVICKLLMQLDGTFFIRHPKSIDTKTSVKFLETRREIFGLLCAVDRLKSPPNIRAIVGLPPRSNVGNAPLFDGFTMDDLLNKAVQIVSIVCQWPETTLNDLDGFLKTLAIRSTSVHWIHFYKCTWLMMSDRRKLKRWMGWIFILRFHFIQLSNIKLLFLIHLINLIFLIKI